MKNLTEAQKKKLMTATIALVILFVGLVTGLVVVNNRTIVQNKAQTPALSCSLPTAKCVVDTSATTSANPYFIQVKQIAADKSESIIAKSEQGATEVGFPANPLNTYVCETVAANNDTCRRQTSGNAPLCKVPEGTPPPNTPPPPTNPPSTSTTIACACGKDGGTLDCSDRSEGYPGETGGNGLVIINPKYKGNTAPMCFRCDKLIVSDGTQKVGEYDCSGFDPANPGDGRLLPAPTGIRLHIAKGAACRDYTIEVLSKSTDPKVTGAPVACGNCTGKVCCPKCQPPVKTDCGTFTAKDGKTVNCDFDVAPACGAVGKNFTVIPHNNTNYHIDFDDSYKASSGNSHVYNNAGVYDIKMSCNYNGSSGESEKVCTQRIVIGCGNTPTPTGTTTTTTNECPGITFVDEMNECIYE